jgi:hypothetical protein
MTDTVDIAIYIDVFHQVFFFDHFVSVAPDTGSITYIMLSVKFIHSLITEC